MRNIALGRWTSLLVVLAVALALTAGWGVRRATVGALSPTPARAASAPADALPRPPAADPPLGQEQTLSTQGRTTVTQFPLVPASLQATYPKAGGLVTILRGDRDNATSDSVTVDVHDLPPSTRFTIFYTELEAKPFGDVEYVGDLTTRANGSGETVVQDIAFVAFAMDARNPGTSIDGQEGITSGTNLEHFGLWFASLSDAQRALHDSTLTGTVFDAGTPPMHAGPQALTDGQPRPVF
jgi:hypothetical protein